MTKTHCYIFLLFKDAELLQQNYRTKVSKHVDIFLEERIFEKQPAK